MGSALAVVEVVAVSAAPETFPLGKRCPHCGALARVQPTAAQISRWLDAPPETVVMTYQCHWQIRPRQTCNRIFEITARDFQEVAPLLTPARDML